MDDLSALANFGQSTHGNGMGLGMDDFGNNLIKSSQGFVESLLLCVDCCSIWPLIESFVNTMEIGCALC